MKQVLTFTFDRSTKNTHVFLEDGDEPVIGKLYIRKTALPSGAAPTGLKVTVETL